MASLRCLCWVSLCFSFLVVHADGQVTHPEEVWALKQVRRALTDPYKYLNWTKGDPCVSNWTGVICNHLLPSDEDGYLHVQELRLLNMNLSGVLAPELGLLIHMTILNFMWNRISGSIPKEIGNITDLNLLLLSGNNISGSLPDELGNLPNLTKFQLDLNNISGPLPNSFVNLKKAKHFHMNNNSISGQIPPELYKLPLLIHFLLDNNNLSGYLPPELANMPKLEILQLDNNNFGGSNIPDSYGGMPNLTKLSLRNCNLQGSIPDFSKTKNLLYLDLSFNQLTGTIPTNRLSDNITTIKLSNNNLAGTIPVNFSGLPSLQKLSLENNFLNGYVPTIWQNMSATRIDRLILEFQNNNLSNISGSFNPPPYVNLSLQGNPICSKANEANVIQFCGPSIGGEEGPGSSDNSSIASCSPLSCASSDSFEFVPNSLSSCQCFCAAPLGVVLRLRSPSITDFRPYENPFEVYMTSNLQLYTYQLYIDSFEWKESHRLWMNLKFFPQCSTTMHQFNDSEIHRLMNAIATFTLPTNETFGPYDLLSFTLLGPYSYIKVVLESSKSGLSKGVVSAIVLGAIFCSTSLFLAVAAAFWLKQNKHKKPKEQQLTKVPIKIEGVKGFSFEELEAATNSFSISAQVGQGGYGKVYRGILTDGTIVAIKRAQEGSLQGQKEFFTEIETLSRLHHRNLVSLVGYCNEEGEQMLVYDFMPNGSLRDLLSDRLKKLLNFARRLQIALDSSKGILYLHTEADPPIIHRDIKTNNILLDSKFTAKVSDFGISKIVPLADGNEVLTGHISTTVRGTPGYLDPEYFLTHKLTEKSDVYGIGIVFLELLTGMRPISHGRNIVREVLGACQSGMMFSIIDRSMGPYPSEFIKRFMALALKCCEDESALRPSMLEVVRELENISLMLPKGDVVLPDLDASSSGGSVFTPLAQFSNSEPSITADLGGSDLVSGVIPSIRPR